MLKKTINFTDMNGQPRSGEFYFNLTKAETMMWLTTAGEYTLDKVLLRLSEERNGKKIMEMFEDIIHRSYGKKSLDGVYFEKNEQLWQEFYQSNAYSEMFVELVTDAKKAADFVRAIIPSDIADEISKALKDNREGLPAGLKDYVSD